MKDGDKHTQRVHHELSTRTISKILLAVALVWLVTRLWPILLVLVAALILVGTIGPLVERIERRGVRRAWAVALVFLSLSGVGVVVALLTLPAVFHELIDLLQNAPQLQARLAAALAHSRLTAPLAASVEHFRLDKLVSANAGQTLEYSGHVLTSIGYTVTSVVLALYIVADRDRARGALYAWVPRAYHVRLARVLLNLESIVGGYMRGQVITSLAIAVFAFAVLSLCRVPNALALACFAGMTDVIPFVGGLLATTPAVLAALPRGLLIAAIVLASFLVYQSFESRVLVPRIYGRALRLSSATVLMALLIGGELLGVVGALIALPVAAAIRMLIEELRVDLPGDDTDDTVQRARDAREERVYAARTAGADPEEAAAVAVEIAAKTPPTEPPK
jgi:predicted PurR-regulated permease PerM